MSVSFQAHCASCGRKLEVDGKFLEQTIECPACHQLFQAVPLEDASATWWLDTPEGVYYGPIGQAQLDQWVLEGRVTQECRIREAADLPWKEAVEYYPVLIAAADTSPPMHADAPMPLAAEFAESLTGDAGKTSATRRLQAHRGGLILMLGIVGLISCPLFGLLAWILGARDLRLMQAQLMDSRGQSLTQAGQIVGMFATLVSLVLVVGLLVYLLMYALT